MSTLQITDLHASVVTDAGETAILKGVDLTVESGRTQAVMGPNGSGKSTLAYVIAGHPKYTVTQGSIVLDGEDRSGPGRRGFPGGGACAGGLLEIVAGSLETA